MHVIIRATATFTISSFSLQQKILYEALITCAHYDSMKLYNTKPQVYDFASPMLSVAALLSRLCLHAVRGRH